MVTELNAHLNELVGKTLKTLDRNKPFDILHVTHETVIVYIHAGKKERFIPIKELEGAFLGLMANKRISRSEIEELYSPRNPAYVAAILAAFPGVDYSLKPIALYIK